MAKVVRSTNQLLPILVRQGINVFQHVKVNSHSSGDDLFQRLAAACQKQLCGAGIKRRGLCDDLSGFRRSLTKLLLLRVNIFDLKTKKL